MERTCVGCHATAAPSELVRLVLGPEGSLVADARGGSLGRGAWVHPTEDCVRRAIPRGIARTLRAEVKTSADEVLAQLSRAGIRRVLALISAAKGAHKAAAGATAASEAIARGEAELVVVARDARAAAELSAVVRALGCRAPLVTGRRSAARACPCWPDSRAAT